MLSQTPQKNYYAVIMAGGVGSRFFPVSTPERPKQFHDMLGSGRTLIQQTYFRINALIPSENILISSNEKYVPLIEQQLPDVLRENLVLEPAMRNTAPAILYSALKIYQKNPDAVMLVAPSDHWIDREDIFIEVLSAAFEHCATKDQLITMGILPTYPNTGYGYIQFQQGNETFKKVNRFTEKPNFETAEKFIQSGDYLWNAGIFVWSVKSILKAFSQYLPNTLALFEQGNAIWNTAKEAEFISENYPKAENISIDYAILEKADNVYVIPVDMGWNDLGTWGALFQKLPKSNENNAWVKGNLSSIQSHGNLIYSDKPKRVLLNGVQDLIIVEYDDILMILPQSEEQNIKKLSEKL